MGKMMSILEKYKIVEKNASETFEETTSEETISDELPPVNTEEERSLEEQEGEVNLEPETMPHTMPNTSTEKNISQETTYDRTLNIEEIYHHFSLNSLPETETVYLLENLMKALPTELPDFVKKTTVHNIIKASNMNLEKLLEDGNSRFTRLESFKEEYTTNNTNEIEKIKEEIEHLSMIIAQHHQHIHLKEKLIHEESTIIETEVARISGILNFFRE